MDKATSLEKAKDSTFRFLRVLLISLFAIVASLNYNNYSQHKISGTGEEEQLLSVIVFRFIFPI